MSAAFRGKSLIVPLVITGLGAMTVASAQDSISSPFAKKAKKQAWETELPAPPSENSFQNPQPITAPITAPVTSPYAGPSTVEIYEAPASNPLQDSAKRQIQGTA